MKSQPTTPRDTTKPGTRKTAQKHDDGLGFYRVLAGIPALSTFQAKLTAVVLVGTLLPAFLLVFLIVVGAGRMSGLALIALVVVLTLAGVLAMLWAIRRLLMPLDIAADAIDDVALERPLKRVDLPGSDAAAQIMRGVQALVARNQTLVTESRRERERDEITGLWSRRGGRERAQALIDRETRRGRSVRVVVADVDGFTAFNATHGTGNGDALLKAIGERLSRVTGDDGLAIRWSGDAFLLVQVSQPEDEAEADDFLGRPIVVKGTDAPLTLAVGSARASERVAIDALVTSAEEALARVRAAR